MAKMASHFSGGEIFHGGDVLDACVVHNNVDAPEALGTKGHHGFNLGRLAHVCSVVVHGNAVRGSCCLDFCNGCLAVSKTVEKNAGALGCQRPGNPQADAAGGTCDQSSFAFEHMKAFAEYELGWMYPFSWHHRKSPTHD